MEGQVDILHGLSSWRLRVWFGRVLCDVVACHGVSCGGKFGA